MGAEMQTLVISDVERCWQEARNLRAGDWIACTDDHPMIWRQIHGVNLDPDRVVVRWADGHATHFELDEMVVLKMTFESWIQFPSVGSGYAIPRPTDKLLVALSTIAEFAATQLHGFNTHQDEPWKTVYSIAAAALGAREEGTPFYGADDDFVIYERCS